MKLDIIRVKKNHVIRVVRTRQCTRVQSLGGCTKHAKLEKRACFWSYEKFWKGHDGQIKENAFQNAYLGSIFIPEKYVLRVCFESPFTRMISSLKYKCPPRQCPFIYNGDDYGDGNDNYDDGGDNFGYGGDYL